MKIKAISVKQPWAGLIAAGLKWIEVRAFVPRDHERGALTPGPKEPPPYVGPLVIVSSLQPDKRVMGSLSAVQTLEIEPYLLYGHALCLCNLVLARPMTEDDRQGAGLGIPYPGAIAWVLDDVRPLKDPFAVRGSLGVYDVEVPKHEIM